MINKFFRYIKIYILIKFNKIMIRYINVINLKIKNPKLRVGRFLTLKINENSKIITNSNEIEDNVYIDIGQNGILSLAKASWIGSNVTINAYNILIGKYTAIHSFGTVIGDVEIGDYVMIAKNVFISSGTHHFKEQPHLPIKIQDNLYEKHNKPFSLKVIIEDDVWIGVNCTIMPGVTIGKGAIIGSNSVVLKDVPPFTIFAGSPAKFINSRFTFNPPKKIVASNEFDYPYFYSGFNIEKEPFILLDKPNSLLALSNFSVALDTENKKEIVLEIRALESDLKLQFGDEIKLIKTNFQKVNFKIENISTNIYKFQIPKSNKYDATYKFELKQANINATK